MNSRLIQCAHRAENHSFSLSFNRISDPSSGYGFPCTADGVIIKGEMGEIAWESLGHCIENVGRIFFPPEVEQYTSRYWKPAIVKCDCGHKVYVHVNPDQYNYGQCDKCGSTYNMCGQELTDPRTWMPDDAEGDPERPDCDAYSENR